MKPGRPLDIAIIGMACRFPGARNLAAFWENLLEGRDCTSDVPPDRWDPAVFFDPESDSNDRVYCQRGGYLDAPIEFDPSRHGVMPLAVAGGEPEQFLILDAAREALTDAGMSDGVPDTRRVEVIIGRGNYFNRGNLTRLQHGRIVAQTLALLRELHPDWDETAFEAIRADLKASLPPFGSATITGQLTNATAGRIANRLNLTGASYVIDAASASSLVALDQGARALVEKRADMALVGGVYLGVDVDFPMVFCQLGALSRKGRARPFASDADGTLTGEGVGVVVLKRLADAERDGNRIYAVLKGVGLASDGRRTGLATPSPRGHARAIRRAFKQARIDPATIGLVEGHGLGVPASDLAELRALNAVFPRSPWGSRSLGSLSGQIGHAMPAAGIAALIKTALALHNRVLLPAPGGDSPHPLLSGEASPFAINGVRRPWIHGDRRHPRRAGVNAFGFAGISAHAVLEEHSPSADGTNPGPQARWETEAILLGAADRGAWIARASGLIAWLSCESNLAVSLKDLAFTLNQGDRAGPYRVGLVVKSPAELRDRLQAVVKRLSDPKCQAIRDARGTYFWDKVSVGSETLAFLFPGEGSQYPGMLADLCPHFPEVRALFDTADQLAREGEFGTLPSDALFGGGTDEERLWSVGLATNVVLSAQWALHQLLANLGLRPHAVLGHSSGEFLALAAAGALSVDRQLETSLGELGRIFERLEDSGQVPTARLVAVAADREKVERIANEVGPGTSIAIDNCPHQVVLAGPSDVVEEVVVRLRGQGLICEDLPFDRAYHTAAFSAAIEPVRAFFRDLPITRPKVAVYSCAVASRLSGDVEEIRQLAVDQWTLPVAFRSTIEAMYRDGIRTFVEVGARGNLTGFVDDILRDRPHFAIAANLPRRSGLTQLNHLVAALYAQGVPLRTNRLYERRQPVWVDLDHELPMPQPAPSLAVGFPELRLSPGLVARLRKPTKAETPHRNGAAPTAFEPVQATWPHANGHADTYQEPDGSLDSLESTTQDAMILEHLRTMDAFLETQRQVMGAYLAPLDEDRVALDASASPPDSAAETRAAGPWLGKIERLEPGRELVSTRWIEVQDDPVAEHHTLGGRHISALDPTRNGLPVVPFTVMAEMLAQAASMLVPNAVVIALREVQALKWIRYEAEPVRLELHAWRDPGTPEEVRVVITNKGTPGSSLEEKVVEGRVIFGGTRPQGPFATPLALESARECRFKAEDVYLDQWLFHGPAMQAIVGLGRSAPWGIEGTLRVSPLRGILRDAEPLALHTDPIVLDAFTQLLGCWGMDQLDEGHVIFPLRVAEIAFYGTDPPEGGDVSCQIAIRELSRHLVRVDADVATADGRVWMRISGWEDWRFYWPVRCRDHFRKPDRWFFGESLPLTGHSNEPGRELQAVWLEPPIDFGRPIWREVLEWVHFGLEERYASQMEGRPDREATLNLWARVAAKEAARRLFYDRGEPFVYPADLVLELAPSGGHAVRRLDESVGSTRPIVAMAYTEGVAIALATTDPEARPGVAILALEPVDVDVEADSPDRDALAFEASVQNEWSVRLTCAKNALLHSLGITAEEIGYELDVVHVEPTSGEVFLTPRSAISAARPGWEPPVTRVVTTRTNDYIWAWTVGMSERPS